MIHWTKQQKEGVNMEVWKDILGYEGLYEVSNYGRVKSFKRFKEGKILKTTCRGKTGYYCVNLSKKGESKVINVHRLVAIAFLKKDKKNYQVNHKNGIKSDNRVKNLEWVSASYNIKHAQKILGVKHNKEGLKLGAEASIKRNLNITNGICIFQNYKDIVDFIKKNDKYKNVKERYIKTHVRSCCLEKQKTAYGYEWKYKT